MIGNMLVTADDVYDRATWRRMSSYIDPHKSGIKMKEKKKKVTYARETPVKTYNMSLEWGPP